jgi:hypothetical protein
MGYEKTLKLNHDEVPAILNVDTGVLTTIHNRPNNIPKFSYVFEDDGIFMKRYTHSWQYLRSVLTPLELRAANALADEAMFNTNSLQPFSDRTPMIDLMEVLNVSKNNVRPVLEKLRHFGVFKQFEKKDLSRPYSKYWIFNPYLGFFGKMIKSDIPPLFFETKITKEYIRRSNQEGGRTKKNKK